MASTSDHSLHIVVFPWLAFGHMLPFFELSKSLAKRGHRISFISTPRNIQRLPKPPPQISHLIDFISLPLPKTDGLREAAEATTDLLPEEVPFLKKALDGLELPFADFIQQASPKPDWIIQDFVQYWIPKLGIPCVFYMGVPAAALVFFGPVDSPRRPTPEEFTVAPPWVPFHSKVAYRLHEARKVLEQSILPNQSGVRDAYRYATVMEGCKAVAPRSCKELESEWLYLLQDVFNKPIIPTGLLLPTVNERNENFNESETKIMEWLDKQSSRSVIYIALGTEVMISIELLHELALGLEIANLPFIWGLRRPVGLREDIEMLPHGFQARTKDFGMVVTGWVPQVKVLAHGSVGGFLTHCGWSSLIEGIQSGRPLVLLPIDLDQGLNARLMEEKGIGVEVERNEDGSFTKEDVAKTLSLVMVDDEGEPFRKKAQGVMEAVANRECQEKYIEDFIQHLSSNIQSRKD